MAAVKSIVLVTLTTNGSLFARMARALHAGGLKRVNFSLDSLVQEKYSFITRGGSLQDAWKGILAAMEIGMHPVKVNVVIIKGFNDDEILDFAELAYKFPLQIRFIEFMPVRTLNEVFSIALNKPSDSSSINTKLNESAPDLANLNNDGVGKYVI